MEIKLENLPERIDSEFRFVLLAAERAEQLLHGARPKIDLAGRKPTVIAIHEITDELIRWDYGPAEEPLPEEGEVQEFLEAPAEGQEE